MDKQKNKPLHFNKKWLLLAALPLTAAVWNIADNYGSGYYHRPLSLSPELAANFGEVRENHFHMGLDIRTDGRENLPVFAAADGYVSRVTIEEAGFGKAMYITHPNGTTTVYAHLNHFMDAVEQYVTAKQYSGECWQQDIDFAPGKFTVNRRQRIALSGNTGATEGPHLHFEIRDTRTGNNKNPLLAGIAIPDHIAPVINGLYWYDKTGSIYAASAQQIAIKENNGQYTAVQRIVTVRSPRIALGIEAVDKNTASKYRMGIYKATLYMDGALVYSFALDNINYSDTRYVNACIDYSSWINYSKNIQLLCTLPGNHLPAFNLSGGDGVLNLADKKVHTLRISVGDAAGNITTLQTMMQYDGLKQKNNILLKATQLLLPGKTNKVATQHAIATFGNKAIYDSVALNMTEEKSTERNTASPAIFLHDATVPVHDSFLVQVKTTLPERDPLRKHTIMQLTNEKHSIIVHGKWKGDYMAGWFMELGRVQLIIDTVAPGITLQEGNNKTFTANDKALHIVYKDNYGGAGFFRAELDGHWILFEKKGDRFTYYFDGHCPTGNHTLHVFAGDKAGNVTQEVFIFRKERD